MECNRDEATRAKEIAERKFTTRDVASAKKFAVKAQNLYPGLEGIQQMLATLDVHLSAENKIGGEADWYGVLGVNPTADDETVKKQYRKLALMLHPDKNKSVGADGAFKLISEAWSLLSDKTKRTAYDQRRFLKTSQQKVPSASGGSSAPPCGNGFHNFTNTTSKMKAQKTSSKVGTAPAAAPAPAPVRHSKANTFWTVCHRCKMQYEYLRVYLNHNLLCPNCHEPFFAVETPAPQSNGSNSSAPWSSKQRQNSNHNSANKNAGATCRNTSAASNMGSAGNQSNFQWSPFSRTAGVGGATASAAAASVVQQAYEKVKREREEAQAAARRQEALRRKNHVSKRTSGFTHDPKGERLAKKRRSGDEIGGNAPKQMASGNGGTGMANASGFMQSGFEKDKANYFSVNNKPNGTRELSQLELRNMLAEKAKREIRKKLDEWKSAAASKATEKEKGKSEVTEQEKDKKTAAVKGDTSDENKGIEFMDVKKGFHDKASLNTYGVVSDTEARDSMSITVPDPDFHDFDRDRSERSFGDNQVWAAYDDDDGMPRYYAMIHNVMSLNPFKMRISWLNSKTNTELGPLNWIGSGFSKTCGDFRVGKYEINSSLNSFSHKVRWTKGTRGAVRIFPRKGDVWAVYRNWSPDWNELTPDEVIHKYDMVEVLEDYNEDHGVSVTPLVKVAGFKTVFHRHLDPREVRRIPREEMFRFSHQVPSYLLTGSEAQSAPKGCRELDPAATPVELLQVITEAKEEDVVEIAEEEIIVGAKEEKNIAQHKEIGVVEVAEEEMIAEAKEKKTIAEAKEKDVVVIAEEEIIGEAKEEKVIAEPKEEDIVEIAEEEIIVEAKEEKIAAERKEEDILEIADDEMIVETKGEQVIAEPNKEDVLETADEEMIVEAKEEQVVAEPNKEDVLEIADEEMIVEAEEEQVVAVPNKDVLEIAGEEMIVEAKEEQIIAEPNKEDVVEIADEEIIVEAKEEKIVKNDEKQKVKEAGEEIVENALKQVTTGSNEEEMVQDSVEPNAQRISNH
ncbi:DnaJ domain [Macleaya cordata]|uniref:DnaJ domain n=1 Tax=Macleaya cordata TaxID=56857 RepID=A0A200QGM0_MACCD|nr:DnaJ domain [Macleaya cordata]